MVAMELLPGVVRLAREFRAENGGVLDDPRVELRLADGRNHLFGSDQRFDAIVGDLFIPWHAGTGSLYTIEHFENVRERLSAGGVFVQWLQLDQVSRDELEEPGGDLHRRVRRRRALAQHHAAERPLLAFVGFRGRTARARSRSARCGGSAARSRCGMERRRAAQHGRLPVHRVLGGDQPPPTRRGEGARGVRRSRVG